MALLLILTVSHTHTDTQTHGALTPAVWVVPNTRTRRETPCMYVVVCVVRARVREIEFIECLVCVCAMIDTLKWHNGSSSVRAVKSRIAPRTSP